MEDKLFDFEEIVRLFKRKFWIIIFITAVTTGIAYYEASSMRPSYNTSLNIFIAIETEGLDYSTMQQMNFYGRNIKTLKDMIMTEDFIEDVLQKNNINRDAREVRSGISVTSSEDSPVVSLKFSSGNSEMMKETLEALGEEFISNLKELVPDLDPIIVNTASVSTIWPNKNRVIQTGIIIGLVISIGLILVLDYLDDTIREKKDLEKVLPIPVLGDIPRHEKKFSKGDNYDNITNDAKVNIS